MKAISTYLVFLLKKPHPHTLPTSLIIKRNNLFRFNLKKSVTKIGILKKRKIMYRYKLIQFFK